ncbi:MULTISPECIES: hypothetical protein [unclassified Beijerinckia]|uniref:hypothetical protein n=1 Tax=unclassified Beijerinckia TaxID=2638183 RepID=UPI00089AEA6C|nr:MULTISPECIES: hypothetical protein [unclassified Beijerinckia]MDH7796084.1 hypothetical protein [Beijerinckia sp. GAS462]SEC29595.1 hypothetical protein SAMN05443249_2363 [Beijerinckia sp. 28-YEA-48]
MSEPDAAFLKLQIGREPLVRWLDSPTPLASTWQDWRSLGGQWYFGGDVKDIQQASDAELKEVIDDCDARLGKQTNRSALRGILKSAEAPHLSRSAYDAKAREYVVGSLTYSENLMDFVVFLTVARGAAVFLQSDDYGIAVLHNYIWGDENERITQAALRLGPGPRSEFLPEADWKSAAGAFQTIANDMLSDPPPPPRDDLDLLK